MKLVSQVEMGKVIGKPPRTIRRWAEAGHIKRYERGKVDYDEVMRYLNAANSDPLYVEKVNNAKRQNEELRQAKVTGGKTSKRMPETEEQIAESRAEKFQDVRMHKEAFSAKTAEARYRKEIGELISVVDAKRITAGVLEYYNSAFDNLPIMLRSKNDKITTEIVNQMFDAINEIKENTAKLILEQKWN